jgi:hypothetical protein
MIYFKVFANELMMQNTLCMLYTDPMIWKKDLRFIPVLK